MGAMESLVHFSMNPVLLLLWFFYSMLPHLLFQPTSFRNQLDRAIGTTKIGIQLSQFILQNLKAKLREFRLIYSHIYVCVYYFFLLVNVFFCYDFMFQNLKIWNNVQTKKENSTTQANRSDQSQFCSNRAHNTLPCKFVNQCSIGNTKEK